MFGRVFDSYLFLAKTKRQWPAYFAFKGENLLMRDMRDNHGQLKCKKDLDYAYALTVHKSLETGSYKTYLIDWDLLRASYTPFGSNDRTTVKEMKIGQSAAKLPNRKNVHRLSREGVHLLLA